MPQKQKIGVEEKVKIIMACKAGEVGIEEAARRAGVSRTTLQNWI